MARKMGLKDGDFEFTCNWFLNRNLPTFREYVYPKWQGKPITYLEIGVFEGMSMVWMLQHVLTHMDSKAVGIDPWLITAKLSAEEMGDVMTRATKNTSTFRWQGVCSLICGNSIEVLTRMLRRGGFEGIKKNSVDICMIDGDHTAPAVLENSRKCLKLMKPGGWMLFDDVENQIEKNDHVKQGLESFRENYKDQVKLIWKHKFMECYEVQ